MKLQVALALALTTSCASTGALTTFAPGVLDPIDVKALPPVDDHTPARVLLDEEVVRFEEVDGAIVARVLRRTVTRIHNAAGQERRSAEVGLDRTFTDVEAFFVRTFDAAGHTRVYGEKETVELPQLGNYYLYSDNRVRRVEVAEQPRGGVVEVVSLVRHRQPEMFAFSFAFVDDVEVDIARFAVEAPAAFEVEVLTERAGVQQTWEPVVTTVDGRLRRTWEQQHIAARERPLHGQSLGNTSDRVNVRLKRAATSAGVVVAGPTDVRDLSRVISRLMAAQAEVTPEIKAITAQVLGASPTSLPPRERAAKLYAWTRDSIRYCSISIGMGGWVPHTAAAVEGVRYGDCKDKANLLKSLLAAVDVDSRIVVIYSGAAPHPFRLPVVASNFNHAILQVRFDDGDVFVDPTTRTVAFDDLPPNDEERLCLPLDEAGSDLVSTPTSTIERDRRLNVFTLSVDDGGALRGTVESTHHGHFADDVRDEVLQQNGDELVRVLPRLVGAPQLTLEHPALENAVAPVNVTPVVVRAAVKDEIKGADGRVASLVAAADFIADEAVIVPAKRPRGDVVVGARSDVRDEVRLKLPPTMTVRQVPPPAAGDSTWFGWSIAWTIEGDELVARRSVQHKVVNVAADDVDAYRAVVDAYLRAYAARVVMNQVTR